MNRYLQIALVGVTAASMAACGGKNGSTRSDSAPDVPQQPLSNSAPLISGTPAGSVTAGSAYSFLPNASDADGNPLSFSIANRPDWAAFSTATGQLTGTPSDAQFGTYVNIVISVSDGNTTRALPAFSIDVLQVANTPAPTPTPTPAPTPVRTASLSWTAPSQTTDGSALADLAGYRIYHGTSADTMNEMTQVPGAATTAYTFNNLNSGTHYFAVAAYTSTGSESPLSAIGSKTIQ